MLVYLDNAATTRPFDEVVSATVTSMLDCYWNPSAPYAPAMNAERELRLARQAVAESVGASEKEVLFTSGGTESDNLAIIGAMIGQRRDGVILYSAAEHSAVKNACLEAAALHGQVAKEIPLTADCSLDLAALEGMLDPRVRLICVMQVSNETGVIMPLHKVVRLRDRLAPQAAIHVDGVQGYLRVPFSMAELAVQSYAISGHKVHGPRGVGALVVRDGHRLRPLLVGGGQQGNLRSGTENTPGIAGLREAVQRYPHEAFGSSHMKMLKQTLLSGLSEALVEYQVLGKPPEDEESAGHILAVSFPPVRAETLVHALEAEGILIGTGSACSARKGKRSPVLTAMRVPPEIIDSTVRVSFSIQNTREEAAFAAEKIAEKVRMLGKFRRR